MQCLDKQGKAITSLLRLRNVVVPPKYSAAIVSFYLLPPSRHIPSQSPQDHQQLFNSIGSLAADIPPGSSQGAVSAVAIDLADTTSRGPQQSMERSGWIDTVFDTEEGRYSSGMGSAFQEFVEMDVKPPAMSLLHEPWSEQDPDGKEVDSGEESRFWSLDV